uniref:Gamma-tubulin complex component n=1 Tax=Amblyomma maculatum TaxID=34609 RepID=G3MTN1_AMBMU
MLMFSLFSVQIWMALQDHVLPPYWSRCSAPVAPASTSTSSNLAKDWEAYLNSCGVVTPTGEHSILTERIILREVLWMMRGTKDLFVFSWNGARFVINDNFMLSHVTQTTLRNILEEMCHRASHVAHLLHFVSSVVGSLETVVVTLTFQAFANSILEQLEPYNRHLVYLEKKVMEQRETLTLAMLLEEMEPYFQLVSHIYDIYCSAVSPAPPINPVESTVKLLRALEQALESATVLSQENVLPQTVSLYLDSVKPYIDFIDELSSSGKLVDPYQEFPIRRAADIALEDPRYWKESLYICSSDCLDNVLGSHLVSLNSAGKSMEHLIHATQSKKEVLKSKSGILYASIVRSIRCLGSKLESMGDEVRALENVEEISMKMEEWSRKVGCYGLVSLERGKSYEDSYSEMHSSTCRLSQIQQAIRNAVAERCSQNSAKFLHYLKSECELSVQIEVIHNHFLMFAGDIMHSFASEMFSKLLSKTPEMWQNLSILNFALQEALSWHCTSSYFLKNLSMRLRQSSPKVWLDGFDNVVFCYSVSWPVTIVLTETTLDLYNRIFVFLCKVKCAKFAVEELHFQALNCCECETSVKQTVHFLQLLRFQALSFLNSFHACLMQDVLHSSKLVFDAELQSATDLDMVIKCHEDFVAKVYRQCLLSEPFAELREGMLILLQLGIKLHVLWNSGVESILLSDVRSIHDKFLKHHVRFKHLARLYISRGYGDSSQLLTFALNMDTLQPMGI